MENPSSVDPKKTPEKEIRPLERDSFQPNPSQSANDNPYHPWDSPTDPSNPHNWSWQRKWSATLLTSLGGLVTLMSGAMLAPALSAICRDLHTTEAEASMALSIYILAFAFGPMVLAPCSEVFGRRPVWIFGAAWYTIWNMVCGFSKNRALLITGRLLSGLGASAEFAVSGPIVNDCWSADERGKSMAIRGFLPLLGPALGPIFGGVMVQHLTWRWLFWALSILDAIILLVFIIALPETHHPIILARKASARRKQANNQNLSDQDVPTPALIQRIKVGLARPSYLLFTEPTIQIMSLVLAYQFGVLYIMLSTFSTLWTERYIFSPTVSGLHYIAIVIGYTIASQLGGWATDRIWARYKRKNNGVTKPEYRIPLMIPGAILIPAGLLWYGWSAEEKLHWIMPDFGVAILGCGLIAGGYAAQAYIIEAFLEYNASAMAATQLLRNVFAFAFPIFAPGLYHALGYGLGNTVLAVVAMMFGFPVPYVVWRYGERLRSGRRKKTSEVFQA